MIRTSRPAVDPRVVPVFGTTREGQPLSYNRAPAPDLAPWLARLSVTRMRLAEGQTLACGLFADAAGIRIHLGGHAEVDTVHGVTHQQRSAVFMGPQTKILPVRLSGDFVSVGVAYRPSACTPLLGPIMPQLVDRVTPALYWPEAQLLALFKASDHPEAQLQAVEGLFRERVAALRDIQPEPITAHFEEIAFTDPAMSIAQAAREIGVDRRRLERLVVRDFGLPPKQVLRRARALDMASYLRGVADDGEAEALALRYYDESHLIREFVELFGMSPRQFTALPQPLLTMTLEARQARRLEMMGRLAPGERRPWQ